MSGPIVAIIGQAEPDTGPVANAAEQCGKALAERGATLVTGGRGGVMNAASRGARAAGGRVVAILPGTDRDDATPHADIVVCTGMGQARNLAVVASADVAIAVGGAFGTLSEIGLARKLGRPVVLLESWSLTAPDGGDAGCIRATDPASAVELALGAIG